MTDIRKALKNAKTVLFNDDEHFNKDVTGVRNLADVKDWLQIKGRCYKVIECGNRFEYKLVSTDYRFSLIILN